MGIVLGRVAVEEGIRGSLAEGRLVEDSQREGTEEQHRQGSLGQLGNHQQAAEEGSLEVGTVQGRAVEEDIVAEEGTGAAEDSQREGTLQEGSQQGDNRQRDSQQVGIEGAEDKLAE